MSLTLEVLDSLAEIPAPAWDALVGDACPFLEHAFLWGLEASGCVGGSTGWMPRYVVARRAGVLVGALPAYQKTHSHGEFIFDFGWAEAAARAGLRYYPKLVVGSPFSPVGGRRFLVGSSGDDVRTALVGQLQRLARTERASSIHWLFITEEEASFLEARGFAIRHTHQFHWHNEGFATFDDFLERFRSDRRNQIRRERRTVAEAGITTRVLTGDALTEGDEALAWACYVSTVEKFPWGNLYLNRDFFTHLFKHFRHRISLVKASIQGRDVACALNIQKGAHLYGRYWGCLEEHRNLHFEVCSYAGIEHAITHGLQTFEAGAGGGGHKFGRGFLPRRTWSAHEIFHPALDRGVRTFLEQERLGLEAELAAIEGAVLKPTLIAISQGPGGCEAEPGETNSTDCERVPELEEEKEERK